MILDKNKFYQWDLERTLEIVDNIVTEVHFKKFTDNKLYVCEVYDNNGVRVVDIPNILFTTPEKFTAYFYCNDLFTKQHTSFDIIPRPKPTDYVYTETEVKRYDTLEQEIEELNNAVNELNQKIDEIPTITVDQNYDAKSTNPQSGQAVAQALEEFTPVDENQLIGRKTEEGGVIIGDDDNNKALAKDTFVNGNDNWAGYYGYKITYIAVSPGNDEIEIWLDDENLTTKVKDAYAINDVVQMHLQSHYHDKYYIFQIINDRAPGNKAAIILKPTYGNIITDTFTLVPAENDPKGLRNWLYVIGKPYGEPMKYSKGAATFGNHNIVTGQGALVAGNYNQVPGHAALVGGSDNKVGYAGLSNGTENEAIHNRSATLGRGLKSGRVNQLLAGEFNEVEDDALLVVGGGTGDADSLRKTVFKVKENGDVYAKRDLKVDGEIQYKDVNLTDKINEIDYQLEAPDRYKIVDELPNAEEVTNYSDMYLIKNGEGYDKYIYNDMGKDKPIEAAPIWDGTKVKPVQNTRGQYVIDSAEKLAYVICEGGYIDGETDCNFIITKDIYLNDIESVDWSTGTVKSGKTARKWYTNHTEQNALKYTRAFRGNIDGGYHTIYGIYCPYTWGYNYGNNGAAGLISETELDSTVTIKNLIVDYSHIKARSYASAVVAKSRGNVIISNCGVQEEVYMGAHSAGAIHGGSKPPSGQGYELKITNCYWLGDFNALLYNNNDHTSGTLPTVYGLHGYSWNSSIEITSCFSYNPITTMEYDRLRIKDCYEFDSQGTGIRSEGIGVIYYDDMQGLDVLTNPNKMPLLDKLHQFKATENYPVFKFASFGWIKIDEATKEIHNHLLDLIDYELMEDNTIKILGYKNEDYNSIVGEHIIPDTIDGYPVTVVGQSAFNQCRGLTKIVLPNSLRVIEDYAFQSTSLTEVIFPEGLQVIGVYAFAASQLSYVDLPNSVQEVANGAFDATPAKFINLGQSITKMPDIDNVNITEFIISDNITELGGLTTCTKLKTVIVGKGVTTIPNNFLRYSSEVKNIVLPNNIVTIGDEAFLFSGLETITIPTSVTTIGDYAFTFTSLTDIYYEGTEEQWNSINIGIDDENVIANATIHFNQAPATKDYVETQLNTPKAEMILTDNTTGTNYRIYITDGKLQLEVVE